MVYLVVFGAAQRGEEIRPIIPALEMVGRIQS